MTKPYEAGKSLSVVFVVAMTLSGVVWLTASGTASGRPAADGTSGGSSAEEAAVMMFRAGVSRSPALFTRARLPGVCDGPVDTMNKYAECLHRTRYRSGDRLMTVYDLSKRIRSHSARAVASQAFSSRDVEILSAQFLSTYWCEDTIVCLEMTADDDAGREYRSRIVVARIENRWYAIPRCRSARSFYEIADAMDLGGGDAAVSEQDSQR